MGGEFSSSRICMRTQNRSTRKMESEKQSVGLAARIFVKSGHDTDDSIFEVACRNRSGRLHPRARPCNRGSGQWYLPVELSVSSVQEIAHGAISRPPAMIPLQRASHSASLSVEIGAVQRPVMARGDCP